MKNAIEPGIYRHFKGNEYQVFFVATDTESEEPVVVYKALYGEKGMWVRPLAMFTETIEREGQRFSRFSYLRPAPLD